MPRLPLNASREDSFTYRSSYAGSVADSDWDYSIGAPSVASPRVLQGIPPLELQDLPSARSDRSESIFTSISNSSRFQQTGVSQWPHHSMPCVSELEASGQRSPWPGLEERLWRPQANVHEENRGMLSSRSDRSTPAARHLLSYKERQSGARLDDKAESVAGSDTASWWSSIMPGTSCQSTDVPGGGPGINCSVAMKKSPKERICDERIKESARQCGTKIAERQCGRLTQECEDNIEEMLFRDAAEEVEEKHFRPAIDSWDECQKQPNKLGTLKTWSQQA